MTTIGELFVNLGVKGSDKSLGAIMGVQRGMKDTAAVSLEAKAAIVGAMYALERLFSTSNKTGSDLANFSALMGSSAKTLQQYQYAGRQVQVTNESMEATFKNLSATSTKFLTGISRPLGTAEIGRVTHTDMAKLFEQAATKPEMLLQTLQKYAQLEKNVPLRNEMLRSFVGDDVISALAQNAFRPDVLNKAPAYSDNEAKALQKSAADWSNLGTQIEMSIGHFNAKHGGELIKGIGDVTTQVLKLADAFAQLAEKSHAFDWLKEAFKGWTDIIQGLTGAVNYLTTETGEKGKNTSLVHPEEAGKGFLTKDRTTKADAEGAEAIKLFFGEVVRELKDAVTGGAKAAGELKTGGASAAPGNEAKPSSGARDAADLIRGATGAAKALKTGAQSPDGKKTSYAAPQSPEGALATVLGLRGQGFTPTQPAVPALAAVAPPPVTPVAGGANSPANVLNVNQNLNFQHDGKDSKQTADSVKRAVQSAYRQMPAQRQVT